MPGRKVLHEHAAVRAGGVFKPKQPRKGSVDQNKTFQARLDRRQAPFRFYVAPPGNQNFAAIHRPAKAFTGHLANLRNRR